MSTAVFGIAILVLCGLLLGTAVFGILWVAVSGVVSLVQDVLAQGARGRSRLPRRSPSGALPSATQAHDVLPVALSDASAEAMWHRMQGTSKRSRLRRGDRPA